MALVNVLDTFGDAILQPWLLGSTFLIITWKNLRKNFYFYIYRKINVAK